MAADVYWDVNGATIGASGTGSASGLWDGANAFFNTDSTGGSGGSLSAIVGASNTAVFAAGANATQGYTVTVSGTQVIGGLRLEEGTLLLTGGTIQMGAASNFDTATNLTATVNSVIDGGFDLTKAGAGTLVLGGTNTYSGKTRINAGTLSISADANLGTAPVSVLADSINFTGSSTLQFTGIGSPTINSNRGFTIGNTFTGEVNVVDSTNTVTYGGVVAGLAGTTFKKTGAGTLDLKGASTLAGALNIDGGTLKLSGVGRMASISGFTIGNRGTLTLDQTTNTADRIAGTFASNGGTLNFTHAGAASTNYAEGVGALSLNAGALTINGSQAASGQTSAVTLASITRVPGGTLYFNGTGAGTDSRNQLLVTSITGMPASGVIIPWAIVNDGTGVSFAQTTGNGTTLKRYAGAVLTTAPSNWVAATNARPAVTGGTNDLAKSVNTITFDNGVDLSGTAATALSGDRIITMSGAGGGAILQTGGSSLVTNNGTSSYRFAFGSNEALFHILGTLDIGTGSTADNNLTGTNGLTKTGAGTLIIRGNNTITGTTRINEGILEGRLAASFGTTQPMELNGGTLRLSADAATTFTPTITVNADSTIQVDRVTAAATATTHTIGTLSIGGGRVLSVNSNDITSGTAYGLTMGALTLTSGGVTFNVANNGAGTATLTVTGITNAGAETIAKAGAGNLVSTGTNGYGGPIDVQGGNVGWSNNTAATIITESNRIGGAGGIIKSGSSTVVLTGVNAYSGSTTLTAGLLQAVDGVGLSSGSNLVLNGGTLQSSGTFTRSLGTGAKQVQWVSGLTTGGFSAIAGPLTISLSGGPSPLEWDGTANFVAGSGTLNFGSAAADDVTTFTNSIDLNNTGVPLSRTVTVIDNTSSTADTALLSGVLSNSSGDGSLNKTGTGVLALSGPNSFTGGVTVTAGTLQFSTVSDNGGSASNLGQGTNGIDLGGGNLSFIGGVSQTTNRAINVSVTSTLSANGTSGATIDYTGPITIVPTANSTQITFTGTGAGILSGGLTQTGTTADATMSSGSWTFKTTPVTIADDFTVTGSSTVLNLSNTGVLNFGASTTATLQIQAGATVNVGANNVVNATAGVFDRLFVGQGGTAGTNTFAMGVFNQITDRLDLGVQNTGLIGNVSGTGTLTVISTLNLGRGTINANLAGAASVQKIGLGDVTLLGDNTGLTGATAARIDAGNLILDYTVQNNDKLRAATGLDMGGGTLTITGNNAGSTQSVASLTLANGGANKIDVNNGTLAATLNLGIITRDSLANGGTIRFELPSLGAITTTSSNNNATLSGIVGGWATVDNGSGVFFARNDGSNKIVAGSATEQDAVGSWVSGDNVTDSVGFSGTVAAAGAINSLRFNANSASAITVSPGNVFANTTGGILMTSAAATGAHSIAGGALTSGINELIFTQDSAQGLTVSSVITGVAGITKAGTGTLTLSGTNNFSGITDLQAGTLIASGGNAIGDTSPVTLADDRASTLQLVNDETIGAIAGGNATSGIVSGTIDLGATTLTINETTSTTYKGVFVGTGTVIKRGASTLTVDDSVSSGFSGTLRVDQGQLNLSGVGARFGAITAIELNGSSRVLQITSSENTAQNQINDNATVLLNNTAGGNGISFSRTGGTTAGAEGVGALTLGAGHNSIRATSSNGAAGSLTFASLAAVNNHATALVRGPDLGTSASAQRGQIIFTAPPTGAVGGSGTPATQFAIFPYMISSIDTTTGLGLASGDGNSFVRNTGSTNGLKPLSSLTEYTTDAAGYNALTGLTTNNVRFATNPGAALTGAATGINSLVLDGATITLTGPASSLQITSGAILSAQATANVINTFTGITTSGTTDYTVYVTDTAGSLTFTSPLTTAAPLVKSGAGSLVLSSTSNAFTDVYFNQGVVEAEALNKLGSGTFNFFGGSLKFGAAFDPSSKTITFGTGGGTFDTQAFNPTLANSLGSGSGTFTKSGAGTLTLNAASTLTGGTTISVGTITLGATAGQAIGTGDLNIAAGAQLNIVGNNISVGSITTGASATNPISGSGTITATGNVILAQNSSTFTPTLTGAANLIKATASQTLTINNSANSYTGYTQVIDGKLTLGSIGNAGAASTIGAPAAGNDAAIRLGATTTAGTLTINGAAMSTDRDFWLTGTTGGGTIQKDGTGALTINADISGIDAGAKTLTLQGTAGTLALPNLLNGVIHQGVSILSVTKAEAGVWELANANNYSGTTTIGDGTLILGVNQTMSGGLVFGTAATAGTLDLSSASGQFSTMGVVTNSGSLIDTATIGSSQTLTLTGNVTIGANAASSTTLFTASGGGSFVNNNSGGTFQVGGATGSTNTNAVTANFSGLTIFTVDLGSTGIFRIGDNSTVVSGGSSSLTLGATSSITAGTVNVGAVQSNAIQTLRLGSTSNVINVNTLNVGTKDTGRGSGLINFAAGTGTLTLHAADGTSRAAVNIVNNIFSTGNSPTGTMNLSGHSADLLISTLTMANRTLNTGSATATLTFDGGTLDVTTLNMASRSSTGTGNATATLNLGNSAGAATTNIANATMATNTSAGGTSTATINVTGGTVNFTNTGTAINMANADASRTVTSNINLTGGTATVSGDIIRTGGAGTENGTITVNGGTLDMSGKSIGTLTAPITLAAQSGMLRNLFELNGGGTLTKTTSGILNLDGTNSYMGATTVDEGTLRTSANNVLPSASPITINANTGGTATLDLNGNNNSIGSLTFGGVGGMASSVNQLLTGVGTVTLGIGSTVTTDATGNPTASALISGNLALAAGTRTFNVADSSGSVVDLDVSAVISGFGALTKIGAGNFTMTGATANTYSGLTTVTAGTLSLNKTVGINAILGDGFGLSGTPDVLINGGTLRLDASNQLDNTVSIQQTSGQFNLNGKAETLWSYNKTGGTFRTGIGGSLKGIGNTLTYDGGGPLDNVIDAQAVVEDAHFVIKNGATIAVYGSNNPSYGAFPGTAGGTLQLNAPPGAGLEFEAGTNTINLDSDATATDVGKLLLKGNVSTSGIGSALIANVLGGSSTTKGIVDLDGGVRTFTVAATNPLSVSAVIKNGGLTKAGLGTMLLSGENSYGGSTTVSVGTLTVNGNQAAAAGTVSVASGATLSGIGTVGGATTIAGTHSPGSPVAVNSIGIQTFSSGLTNDAGSTLVWELLSSDNNISGRGTNFDAVNVTGGTFATNAGANSSLVFNSTGSTVSWTDGFWNSDKTWLVYSNTNAPTVDTNGGNPSGSLNFAFLPAMISVDSNNVAITTARPGYAFVWEQTGNDIFLKFTAVPEPASWGGAMVLLGSWFARRRVNRKKKVVA